MGTEPEKLSREQYDIVLFWFMNDWGLYGRAYEKIAEHLAQLEYVRKVLCVLPPAWLWKGYCPFPFELKRPRRKLFVLTPNIRMVPARFPLSSLGNMINERFIPFSMSRILNGMTGGARNTIFWAFPPHRYIDSLLRLFRYRFLVTQIVDNNTFKEWDASGKINFVKSQYEDLAKRSDVLITSSRFNFEYFRERNTNCHMFENALDPVFLGTPSGYPFRRDGTRPRLGYSGWITQRTDLGLLRSIAERRPDCDLILAGPIDVPEKEFARILLPNVIYEGVVPYSRMPEFIRSLDVCLIPHRDTAYSRSMSPLKLFQYLASGRPVVSTRVAGVGRWEGLISIADDPYEFIMKIGDTLEKDTVELSRKRIEAVRGETWKYRVGEMFDVITRTAETNGTRKPAEAGNRKSSEK